MTLYGRRTDMTFLVNRDGFSVFGSSEFPEGDVAVRLDGWSHCYPRVGYRITVVRPLSPPLPKVASRMRCVA
jgi:hypothetical protein